MRGIALSPDGLTLASRGPYREHTVRLWDVSTGEHRQTLEGHIGAVRFLTFSPDGRELSSASSDGTMLFWDLRRPTTWGGIRGATVADEMRQLPELSPSATAIVPTETALLPNYPNPFNPETWIPYKLRKSAKVRMAIFDMHGKAVRTMAVGYRPAGTYRSRNRAAYWDGRNQQGEMVANGVYFCTLSAGDFSATRKMLVGK